jgi:hypothetical protein
VSQDGLSQLGWSIPHEVCLIRDGLSPDRETRLAQGRPGWERETGFAKETGPKIETRHKRKTRPQRATGPKARIENMLVYSGDQA